MSLYRRLWCWWYQIPKGEPIPPVPPQPGYRRIWHADKTRLFSYSQAVLEKYGMKSGYFSAAFRKQLEEERKLQLQELAGASMPVFPYYEGSLLDAEQRRNADRFYALAKPKCHPGGIR